MSVALKSGVTIYYDRYNGHVTLEKPVICNVTRGGILADEMGLGKTVEVLACILVNSNINSSKTGIIAEKSVPTIHTPKKQNSVVVNKEEPTTSKERVLKVPEVWIKNRKSENFIALQKWYNDTLSELSTVHRENKCKNSAMLQCVCGSNSENDLVKCITCGKRQHQACLGYKEWCGPYHCPQCWMEKSLIDCQATLIVTPPSLRTQWSEEIRKHIRGNFKVLLYEGNPSTPVYPTVLQEYNVVITTYNVLQNELRLTENVQVSNQT